MTTNVEHGCTTRINVLKLKRTLNIQDRHTDRTNVTEAE